MAHIHTQNDTLDNIDYDHMAEHVKLVMGFVYELGFAEIGEPDPLAKDEDVAWEQPDETSYKNQTSF